MLFWLKWVKGLVQAFQTDTSPNEVAGAFVLGATIGLIPKSNLTTLIMFLVTYVIRVNLGVAGLAIAVFSLLGIALDPFTEKIGFWVLSDASALRGLWTAFYNTPILPYFAFNNTLVMGNLAFGLLIAVPLFFGFRRFLLYYRANYKDRVANSKMMKFFQATDMYQKYKSKYDKYGKYIQH
jgi:uncharacterized protein (TIGR03546 family)